MRLSEKQLHFTVMVAKLIEWAFNHGYGLTFGEAWRPPEMQAIYLAEGKTKVRYSKHQDRLAIDFNLYINGRYIRNPEKYRPLGEFWESLDPKNRWGGRFGVAKKDWDKKVGWDAGHFEYAG